VSVKANETWPADWPADGPIDLSIHDRPHRSSTTEWWYVNTHVETTDGRRFSVFVAFFRMATGRDEKTKEPVYAHSVTWAITDVDGRRYRNVSLVDKRSPELGLEKVKRGEDTRDDRVRRALREVLTKGKVPLPDRVFQRDPFLAMDQLHLDFDGNTLRRLTDGRYELELRDGAWGASFVLTPRKPPARHGTNGVVKSVGGEDMFYYFIPRCDVTGSLLLEGASAPLARGQGWYDHEFGLYLNEQKSGKRDIAWNWASVQLDDGTEVTAFALTDRATKESVGLWTVVIDEEGRFQAQPTVTFAPGERWRSTRTFFSYPTEWTLQVPDKGLSLTLEAELPDQEFMTVISKAAFWEGRMKVRGTRHGKPVSGLGYVEISGGQQFDDLDGFFGAVGQEVRKSVQRLLPLQPNFEEVRDLVGSAERPSYMEGVDLDQFARTISHPVREITDRGGKSWRSYAALACVDVVGGDSRQFVQWLALPEFMHVGSLIVDDVEDRSTIRRGKPASHIIYGDAIAINAGTDCYFIPQGLIRTAKLSDANKLRIYDLYFEALRAGHAGQAFDIDGLDATMPRIVETGDSLLAEKRVLAVHRLKTAAPAGALARMGAVAGGGTDVQIEAVGDFFESVGLAFQIIDDVLNLKGFKGDLKQRGEDISHGKVTMPVAKAMGLLPLAERRQLWESIAAKPVDPAVVESIIQRIEACGAIKACEEQAAELVERSWARLDPLVNDSMHKLMLRSFGWYVLERHY
jgi:geranylgeranyl pyrophosphate synthase/predicted secreted hydrolase